MGAIQSGSRMTRARTGATMIKPPAPTAPAAAKCVHCGKSPADPVAAPPVVAPAVPPPPSRYRVVKGGTFSMSGGMCRAVEGTVVTLAAYGRDGLARMRGRGIVLEPLPE